MHRSEAEQFAFSLTTHASRSAPRFLTGGCAGQKLRLSMGPHVVRRDFANNGSCRKRALLRYRPGDSVQSHRQSIVKEQDHGQRFLPEVVVKKRCEIEG